MNLKTSFFNKSIVKSDFKRFWWLGALESLVILVCYTFTYIYSVITCSEAGQYLGNNSHFTTSWLIMHGGYSAMLPALIFPPAVGVLLFSYLNSANAVSCMHGLPIKRKAFFASHILSGVSLIVLPILINLIVLVIFRFNPYIAKSYKIIHLCIWTGEFILYSLLAFSLTIAVLMLTGNSVAAFVFTYIFAALPAIAEQFIEFFCEMNLFGYSQSGENNLTNFLYVFPNKLLEPIQIFKYIFFIIAFFALAYWLYKIRKLENNNEVVAFPKLRPMFIYGVAICGGAAGYVYLSEILQVHNILFLIPFGILGMIAAEMIVQKSLKIKGFLKPIIIFCVIVSGVQFAFQADILGYERRIPKVENVSSVKFNFDDINNREYYYTSNGKEVVYNNDNRITSVKTINDIITLHSEIINNRSEKTTDGLIKHITIQYNLRNGKILKRNYSVDYVKYKNAFESVVSSEDIRKQFYPILKDYERNVEMVMINDMRGADATEKITSPEDINALLQALKKDVAVAPCNEFVHRNAAFTEISIIYTRPGTYKDGTPIAKEDIPRITERYYVRNSFENVKAFLEEIGFYSNIETTDQIAAIGVNYFEDDMSGSEEQAIYENGSGNSFAFDKLITNSDDIGKVYDFIAENAYDNRYNADVLIMYADGYNVNMSFSTSDENLPEVLKPTY